jgi:hypothetical protein
MCESLDPKKRFSSYGAFAYAFPVRACERGEFRKAAPLQDPLFQLDHVQPVVCAFRPIRDVFGHMIVPGQVSLFRGKSTRSTTSPVVPGQVQLFWDKSTRSGTSPRVPEFTLFRSFALGP